MTHDNDIWALLNQHQPSVGDSSDRIIYLGDAQDAIPRMLVFDRDLSATDVRIWMCLRTYVNLNHQSNPCPSYETIMDKLGIGSRETVANALLSLRGTRWLSIIGPRRDHNNRVVKNLYALHSEPLAPQDVLSLDEQYMQVLDRLQQHPSYRLQDLGKRLDQAMTDALVNTADNAPLSAIKDRLDTADSIHRPTPENAPGSMFGRGLPPKNESVQLVVDNNESGDIDISDPSTIIVLGSEIQKNTENHLNMDHNEVNTPSEYDNRTTISSSRFINTTTTGKKQNTQTGLNETTQSGKLQTGLNETTQPDGSMSPTQLLHFSDDLIRFTANEKVLLSRLVLKLPLDQRQMLVDELVGQILEKRDTPARIRNQISFARYLVNQQLSGFEIWSSACERMAKKRAEQVPDEQLKTQQVAEAKQREAANQTHREKLRQWEAELAAQKAKPLAPDNQPKKIKS